MNPQTNSPFKINIPHNSNSDSNSNNTNTMTGSANPYASTLRRTTRRTQEASESEYHTSPASVSNHKEEREVDEEEEEVVVVSTRGRKVVKKSYVESEDEDADASPDPEAAVGRRGRYDTRARSKPTTTTGESRYALRTRRSESKNLDGFVVSDSSHPPNDDEDIPRRRLRSHRPPKRSTRRDTRRKDEMDVDYVDGGEADRTSSPGGDADAEEDDLAIDIPLDPQRTPSPDEKRPYALRERGVVNYAIPPPLEEMVAGDAFSFAAGRRPGVAPPRGKKKKGLGWNMSGKELGRFFGEGDSDTDLNRSPRKQPFVPAANVTGTPGMLGSGGGIGGGNGNGDVPNFGRVTEHSTTDSDPLGVNANVTFDEVGGLDAHIDALKEMTLLPLLYPEVFRRFGVRPPRGVLFHGPPGTGKTLLARALAASCRPNNPPEWIPDESVGGGVMKANPEYDPANPYPLGRPIAFFMRKGADALSKWVGEAERGLRMLFEEAKASQPSIIFFDEIDGLAPVRSSKQDQIHASIVSTLLALMDGMDGRGGVVVIGATNRPDSVDPALRRPGRFDREFFFPLPNEEAREKILGIMVKGWDGWDCGTVVASKEDSEADKGIEVEGESEVAVADKEEKERKERERKDEQEKNRRRAVERVKGLARLTKGYGGADLRALTTEAALSAIQRTYPQIYKTKDKLLLDPGRINVRLKDFVKALGKVVPSGGRGGGSSSLQPLPPQLEPLLGRVVEDVRRVLRERLPLVGVERKGKLRVEEEEWESDSGGEEEDWDGEGEFERVLKEQALPSLLTYKPRLLVTGPGASYVGSGVLHGVEGYHVMKLDYARMCGEAGVGIEAEVVQVFTESRRHQPSIVFIPDLEGFPTEGIRTVSSLLMSGDVDMGRVMLLGVASVSEDVDEEIRKWFEGVDIEYAVPHPSSYSLRDFFAPLLSLLLTPPRTRRKRILEELPLAPVEERGKKDEVSEVELRLMEEHDGRTKALLRWRLIPVMAELRKRWGKRFGKRVREEYDWEGYEEERRRRVEIKEKWEEREREKERKDELDKEMDPPVPGEGQDTMQLQIPPVNGANGIHPPLDLFQQLEPEPQLLLEPLPLLPPLHDMDLEIMNVELYRDRYVTAQMLLEDLKLIADNAAVFAQLSGGAKEDEERWSRAQHMLTAAEVSVGEILADQQFRVECERMANRERVRRRKREAPVITQEEEPPSTPTPKRSTRNNGVALDWQGVVDPVRLERTLKRQREDDDEESDSKRMRVDEDEEEVTKDDDAEGDGKKGALQFLLNPEPPMEMTVKEKKKKTLTLDETLIEELTQRLAEKGDGLGIEELEGMRSRLMGFVWRRIMQREEDDDVEMDREKEREQVVRDVLNML